MPKEKITLITDKSALSLNDETIRQTSTSVSGHAPAAAPSKKRKRWYSNKQNEDSFKNKINLWLFQSEAHLRNPFPSQEQKAVWLAAGLTPKQLRNYLVNARKRIVKEAVADLDSNPQLNLAKLREKYLPGLLAQFTQQDTQPAISTTTKKWKRTKALSVEAQKIQDEILAWLFQSELNLRDPNPTQTQRQAWITAGFSQTQLDDYLINVRRRIVRAAVSMLNENPKIDIHQLRVKYIPHLLHMFTPANAPIPASSSHYTIGLALFPPAPAEAADASLATDMLALNEELEFSLMNETYRNY